jgi:hypothetical protein
MLSHSVQSTSALPLTPAQRHLCTGGWVAVGVWLLAVMIGPDLIAQSGFALNSHGHAHLYAHGHPFVDARSWLGLPNAMDVLSNLPLLLAGLWGLVALNRARATRLHVYTYQALAVFFWGLVLTGVGSSIYHWAPDAQSLVLDRLGMAVTFAGALGLAMAERVGASVARNTLLTVLVSGSLSAVMPLTHGNVLPWVVVQFGGMGFMFWAALRKPLPTAVGVSLGGLIALYVLAKIVELGDATVFHVSGDLISGHSLKHLVAALTAWPVVRALRQNAHTAAKPAGQ